MVTLSSMRVFAICQYIAETLGGPLRHKTQARGSINMYGLSSISNFEPNSADGIWSGREEGRAQYEQNLQPKLNALDAELEDREYLIGEGKGRFTVADVMMASSSAYGSHKI